MNVLIVGGGGREHALAWVLRKSPAVKQLWCAPGNPGIAESAACVDLRAEDVAGIVAWSSTNRPDLVVVGPEAPLALGLADRLRESGMAVFGPGAAGARIESSKAFAKEIMAAAGVPTARYARVTSLEEAVRALDAFGGAAVVKADGLAAGKGVVVAHDRSEATAAVRRFLVEGVLGDAGRTLVIEEPLEGQEVSVICLTDGTRAMAFAPAQDHKRLRDGDEGPNTGGMGAYGPADPGAGVIEAIVRDAIVPSLAELRRRGIEYRGALYAGVMLTPAGPKLLEFNCRLGDPEAQVVLSLVGEDLVPLLFAAATSQLPDRPMRQRPGAAVCVVVAASGYPEKPTAGGRIDGLSQAGSVAGVTVFHAGTKRERGEIIASGGRVLGVTAVGAGLEEARSSAYAAAGKIRLEGAQMRRDIGARPLAPRIGV